MKTFAVLLVLSLYVMYNSHTEAAGCGPHEHGPCIEDCKDRENGDYQSCKSCHVYATCSNGLLYDNRPCPANLVWDDKAKRCEWKSTTCQEDGHQEQKQTKEQQKVQQVLQA